jgi:hypothetical protein
VIVAALQRIFADKPCGGATDAAPADLAAAAPSRARKSVNALFTLVSRADLVFNQSKPMRW